MESGPAGSAIAAMRRFPAILRNYCEDSDGDSETAWGGCHRTLLGKLQRLADRITDSFWNKAPCQDEPNFLPAAPDSEMAADSEGPRHPPTHDEWKHATDELRRERLRIDQILLSLPAVVFEQWNCGKPGQAENFVSSYVQTMFGFTREEWHATADFWRSRVHPDDLEIPAAVFAEFFEGVCSSKIVSFRWLAKDGRIIWGETHLGAIRDEAGEILGIRGATFDVTERVHADAELEESKRFLQSALNALSAHIGILDDQGRIIAVNEAWSRFASSNGLSGKNYGVGANYLEVCEHASGACAEEASAVANGIREVIAQRAPEFQLEYPCHSPNENRWFVVRVTRFRGDGPVRVVVAHENITGRRQVAEDLAANQELLRQFIRHTPAAIAMLDNQMRYIQTSERWIQDYQLTGMEVIGKSHYEIFPDAPERWKGVHQRALAGAVERCEEDAFPRADGSTVWIQWEVRPWLNAGGGIGGLIIFTQVITGRKRADEELQWKTALLEAQVDSYAVGILVVDHAGRKILQNERMTDLWGIPPEIAASSDDNAQVRFVVGRTKTPELFRAGVDHLYAHPEECSADEIELVDGTILDRFSAPVMGKDGHHYGRIWTFADITERKQAEAETAQLHLKLLELSRQAGMAEVATSVLHNVGNVLNSVNVSCSVIAEKVRKSRIASVGKTADLLQAHAGNLALFFSSDAMGQKLPDFIGKLAARLSEEQVALLEEVQTLARNIDHIRDIVAMQQTHAKVSSVTETVRVVDLVEESLHLNIDSLSRHDVHLVREYDEVTSITVEKHRVLQILVNLLRNAKQACNESGRSDKQLTVRVTDGDGTVRIAIIDNGVGILPENLTRIFAHGFTTRKDGHGFGLHSAVIAAQEMGGDLTARSDGPGTGATFILELPLTPDRA